MWLGLEREFMLMYDYVSFRWLWIESSHLSHAQDSTLVSGNECRMLHNLPTQKISFEEVQSVVTRPRGKMFGLRM